MADFQLKPPKFYRAKFRGSNRLFKACWSTYRAFLRSSIDSPSDDEEVHTWLDTIAADKVNNPKSTFYIYG
jgi:hypothetical protein